MLFLLLLDDSISQDLKDLYSAFEELLSDLLLILKTKMVSIQDFLKNANHYFSEEIGYEIENISDYFTSAQYFGELSILHYSELESIVRLILGDDINVFLLFNKYEKILHKYLSSTKIKDIIKSGDIKNIFLDPQHRSSADLWHHLRFDELGVEVDESIEEKGLQYLVDIWNCLHRNVFFSQHAAIVEDVSNASSTQIILSLPKNESQLIRLYASKLSDVANSKIKFIWINKECVYHRDILKNVPLVC